MQFILATSDGTEAGIDKRSGGLCVTRHMKMKFEVHSGKLAVAVLFMFWLRYTIWQYSIVDYQLADQVCSPGFQAGLSTAGFPSAPCQRVQPVFILISIHLVILGHLFQSFSIRSYRSFTQKYFFIRVEIDSAKTSDI